MTGDAGLAFSTDGGQLVAAVLPTADRPPLNAEGLRDAVAQAVYGAWFLFDDALATLIERCNSGVEGGFELPIGERRDASFSIELTADAMQAWLSTTPAHGGKPLEAEEIFAALGETSVTFGIDEAAIRSACDSARPERVVAAAGTPAVNGEDARFELLVAEARDRSPQVDEHGLIDFRELGAIPTVAVEQPLMRRIPATTGTVGRNVRGEVVAPVPGHDEAFAENLAGTDVANDDANLLLASCNGQPVCCRNGVSVEHVVHFRNINVATGNISFDGTVNIEGEVLPGMKVHAAGDIVVGGIVDGAELKAGGDIRIAGGIIAKAVVSAGGSVAARFVENAQVIAGGAIAIDDSALQSELQANNQIVIGVKSPQRGRLAGGSARAMLLIRTPVLGSPTSGVTRLLLGVNPVLEARHQELAEKIAKLRAEEENLDKLVKYLAKQGDKADMLARAKNSWHQAVKAWAKLMPEREELERQLALAAGARIEVGDSVAGAVDLTFGKKGLHLRRPYDAGVFSMEEEHIAFTDASGNVTTVT
ncbi:DUF342 domain-containing protein [Propionivibrio limicola]|uniref:DUF342 domain-containing protein n=1 Tax=Propionivibrio limicola TaxID=167645 RepID=UPI001292073A|nr:FapA family protein [Propionivibrio limicola]